VIIYQAENIIETHAEGFIRDEHSVDKSLFIDNIQIKNILFSVRR
jgi:hypothetical protein